MSSLPKPSIVSLVDASEAKSTAAAVQALILGMNESIAAAVEASNSNHEGSVAASIVDSVRAGETGSTQVWADVLSQQLRVRSSPRTLFNCMRSLCHRYVHCSVDTSRSDRAEARVSLDARSHPAAVLPVLRAIESACTSSRLECPASLDLQGYGLLLPRLMRWPGDSGFTVAIWARLDAWPEPGTVGSTVDAAARGVGIPLPGEELLFRFRAVNGVGVELAVRSGGQVVSRVTGERGRVLDELTGASGAGKLAVGRWHRIIATYKTSMMGLFQ